MYGVTNRPVHTVVDGYVSHGFAAFIFSADEDGRNMQIRFSVETSALFSIIIRLYKIVSLTSLCIK
jgi:hypothetical protein